MPGRQKGKKRMGGKRNVESRKTETIQSGISSSMNPQKQVTAAKAGTKINVSSFLTESDRQYIEDVIDWERRSARTSCRIC